MDYNEGNPTGDLEDAGPARRAEGAAGRRLSEGGHALQRQPLRRPSRALVRRGQAGRRQGLPGLPARARAAGGVHRRGVPLPTTASRARPSATANTCARTSASPHWPRRARPSCPRSATHGRNCASRRAYCWCWTCPGRWDSRRAAGKTRLELAQAAAVNGLAQLSDADEVGLWAFPDQQQVYWQYLPVEPLGPQRERDDQSHPAAHPVGRYTAVRRHPEGVGGGPQTAQCGHDQRDRRDDRRSERVPGRHRSRRPGPPAR